MIVTESNAGTNTSTSTVMKPQGATTVTSTASQYQQGVDELKKKMGQWAGEPKNQTLYQQTATYVPWWPFTTMTGGLAGTMPVKWGQWGTAQPQQTVPYSSMGQTVPNYQPTNFNTGTVTQTLAADKNRSRGINRNNSDMFDPRSRSKNEDNGYIVIPKTVTQTPTSPYGDGGGGSPFASSYGGWGGGGGGGGGGGYGNGGWDWNLINWNVR